MTPILEAKNLTFCRNDVEVFSDVNLTVNAGEILHLNGANGAGKTSLIRLLLGLLQPAEGTVKRHYSPNDLAYVGHRLGLKELLTVEENLDLSSPLSIDGINNNVLIRDLSEGQRQRVALTRLWIKPTKLWMLDEPMTALDKDAIKWFANLLEAHCQNGGAAVIASHNNIPVNNVPVKMLSLEKQGVHS